MRSLSLHFITPLRYIAFLFVTLLPLQAIAQNAAPGNKKEPVQMEVSSPLALTQKPLAIQARNRRWFPIAVTLTNSGEPVQGTLTLRLSTATMPDRNPTEFFTDVDLPTNARKRVWLYGRVERADIDKFQVAFTGRGFRQMRAEGVVQIADESTRVVVTISDSDEKLSYLAGLRGAGLGLPLPAGRRPGVPDFSGTVPPNPNLNVNATPVRPLGAPHEMVPSRWAGFDSADMVVLHDFPHTALTPNQISALRSYVASGGSLLVLGGANWQRLATSPLADLWPVTPASSGGAAAGDVSTLVNRFARFPDMEVGDRLGGATVVATRGTLKSGCRVLLGQSSAPLLAVNDFGAGQVLFLSIDPTQPPFLGWRGLPRLWADVFRPAARPAQIASVGDAAFEDEGAPSNYYAPPVPTASASLLEALATSPQMRTPPVSFIAWFLALYVFFLVPVNYVVLRFFDRRELAWITIPIIVIAFSFMSYAAALRIKGTAILTRQVNLVQGSASVNGTPSKWARADAMLWLFSPRKTTYDISSADPQMVVADYISDERTPVSIRQPEENRAFALDDAPINMWDYRSFVGHAVSDLKGGVRLVTKDQSVGIRNDTQHELKGVVLVSHGRVRAFKSVASGKTGFADRKFKDDVSLSNAQLAGRVESASRFDPKLFPIFSGQQSTSATGFASIPSKLLNMTLSDRWSTPSTFIVAWSEMPIAGMTIGQEGAKAQNLSLLVFRVANDSALRPLLARGNASTSTGEARVRLVSSEAVAGQNAKAQGAIYTYEAQLANADVSRIHLNVKAGLEGYDYGTSPQSRPGQTPPFRGEIFNYRSGTWQPLALREPNASTKKPNNAPVGQQNWNLAATLSGNAARQYVLQPDGRIQFRIRTLRDNLQVREAAVSTR